MTQPVTEVTLDNTKTIYVGWEEIVTDTRLDQEIFMANPYQERDLKQINPECAEYHGITAAKNG